MSARDVILARLRSGAPVRTDAERIAEAQALVRNPERPAVPAGPLQGAFLAALGGATVAATSDTIVDLAQLPTAIGRYLASHGLHAALTLPPDPTVRAADWSSFEIHDRPAPDEAAALTVARCGVAETGSLVFDTGPAAPMLPNFLALHAIVLLRAADIVAHLEDIPPSSATPRAHYWVTGVSGTTDIEGQYVRGAHGPRFLHVILLG
ncbi:MAG: LUD domain-containing protein [Sphingomonas sp.]